MGNRTSTLSSLNETGEKQAISKDFLWSVSGTFAGTVGMQVSDTGEDGTWVTSSDTLTGEDVKTISVPQRHDRTSYYFRPIVLAYTSGSIKSEMLF